MERIEIFKAAIAALFTGISALFGWIGWLILAWIAAFVIDIFTGIAAAARNGEWESKIMRDGLYHKAGSLAVLLCAGLLDAVIDVAVESAPVSIPFDYGFLLLPLVCVWYILMEIGSITENAARMGAPVPAWLVRRMALLQAAVDDAAGGAADTAGHSTTGQAVKPGGKEPEGTVTVTPTDTEDGEDDDDD